MEGILDEFDLLTKLQPNAQKRADRRPMTAKKPPRFF
jgi:hypothetical protein